MAPQACPVVVVTVQLFGLWLLHLLSAKTYTLGGSPIGNAPHYSMCPCGGRENSLLLTH